MYSFSARLIAELQLLKYSPPIYLNWVVPATQLVAKYRRELGYIVILSCSSSLIFYD